MALALLSAFTGIVGLFYSVQLPIFKSEDEYQSKYMEIRPELSRDEAFRQFQTLRDSQLTNKFKIQDYSATAIAFGAILLILTLIGPTRLKSPKSKWTLAAIGIGASILTSAASLLSLFIDFVRGEFPWWADTIAIALLTRELPFFFLAALWSCGHLLFLRGRFSTSQRLLTITSIKSNIWLSLITLASLGFVVEESYYGRFTIMIPGSLWIYFYLSLAAGKYKELII